MGNQWVLGLHLIFLSMFLVATKCACLGAQNTTVSCHERERLVLLEFKHSVKDDNKMLSSWVGTNCCSWKGLRCDGATRSIVSLHLRGNYGETYENCLEGDHYFTGYCNYEEDYYLVGDKVNTYLAELRHLKHLDLSGNIFQGSIPEFIGSFKELHYLNLSNAGFSGIIPYHIGNLSNLKVLDLVSSIIQWQIMSIDMTWTSGLSSLEHLDLSYIDLSQAKNIDTVLHMIPTLTYLSLRDCGLYNVDLGLHLNTSKIRPNIQHLDLGFNNFEGQLPHSFQNITSLKFLDLSSYNLSMQWNYVNLLNMIPSLSELHLSDCGLPNTPFSPTYFNFSAQSKIQYLDLSSNLIQGRFPYEIMNMTSLRVLDLSHNGLNSSIPVMPNLLKLDVSYNHFAHIELIGMWRQCHLKELSIEGNFFGRELIDPSTNTSECSKYALEMLDSSGNLLKGSIPESLGRLTNLRVLQLTVNSLTGSIPKALESLRSIEVLDLSKNALTGPIPTFLGKLTELYLYDNQFSGSIPESLGRLTGLTRLLLQSNRLTGPIPTSLGRLTSLQAFLVFSNLLNGTIPVSLGQLTNLALLDVSNNSLEEVVSEAHFANLLKLKYLYTTSNYKLIFNISHEWIPPFQLKNVELGSCKFANGFPQWLQTQRKVKNLVLSNASLHGLLPTWLVKMPINTYLDLSHNKLSGSLINLPSCEILLLANNLFNGSIPRSLCRRTRLMHLDVSRNKLSGNIQDYSFGNISLLSWLKLNDNNLSGKLPRDLGNLIYLQVLDLGNNEFSGNIPEWIGENLTSLAVLRLHKNNFTGVIPQSLCKCSNLQILDVAHNRLTGSIPYCFGELNAMSEAREHYIYSERHRFDEVVFQVMKGTQLEYTNTLELVFNMDLSSNKFTGQIPLEITTLILLVGLNLSHNHFNGSIPDNIGNMTALNSLDFSDNQFTGMIPPSMAALNFLSCLNLSYNNLSGRIPMGNQLQTFNDPSIYAGNKGLCGAPLPNDCPNKKNPPSCLNKYKDVDEPKNLWFYVDIMCGFATGFWGIIGVLLLKKQWRHKLFMIAEVTMDKVFVAVAMRVSKIKRGKEAK